MGASAFPKIWALGKSEIQNIFKGEVEITEKVDGSQFVFGRDKGGEIVFRSKGKEHYFEQYDKMFAEAVETIKQLRLDNMKWFVPGTYIYTEYLRKPKHNVVAYDRIPQCHLIVFGVRQGGNFISQYKDIQKFALALGLETVPLLYKGEIDTASGHDFFKKLIETSQSILGGHYGIEGVVVKNYWQHTSIGDPTICCGKYVRESFKERLQKEWKTGKDELREFIESFHTEARWRKAVQHLQEKGELENDPRDIGKLMKEINIDIVVEEKEEIKNFLYGHFIKVIKRRATAGAAEWYKSELLKKAFEK